MVAACFLLLGPLAAKNQFEVLGQVDWLDEDTLVIYSGIPDSGEDREARIIFAVKSLNPDKDRPETASFTAAEIPNLVEEMKTCVRQAKTLEVGTRGEHYLHDKLFEPGIEFSVTSINTEEYGPLCSLFWIRSGQPVGAMFLDEKNLPALLKILESR